MGRSSYYGLRRSEVLGIKWSAIDFTENMITIRHTVHSGKDGPIGKDRLKTKSSYPSNAKLIQPKATGEILSG